MNNIYDILAKFNSVADKQTLTEGARPDFLDLDRDGNKKEPMKQAARQAKSVKEDDKTAAREAGISLGHGVIPTKESDMDESALQAYLGKKKYGEQGMKALQKAGRDGAGQEKMAKIRKRYDKMDEADMEEGNDFTGARLAAIKAGKPTFKVDGKTYRVTGDTSDEKVMEREFHDRDTFDNIAEPGDTYKKGRMTVTKTKTGMKVAHEPEEESDDDGDETEYKAVKKKGRPKGSKRALGAKGPTGKSKLLKKGAIKEMDMEDAEGIALVDKGEYDREGEMAKDQLHTIEAAAKELHDILSDDQNLPEWVQSKITKAMDYIDTARDYMASKEHGAEEEMVPERKLTKPEMSKREKYVKSMKKSKGDFEKRYGDRGEEVMYATATKMAKKKAEESKDKEEVEETTVAGSVAVSTEAPKGKGKKGGIQFGKGIYEGFEKRYNQMLSEGMSINASQGEDGSKSLTVTATDDDAVKLAQILKLAGMEQAQDYHDACPSCGAEKGMCEHTQMEEGEYANSPEEEVSDTDTMINTLSGGLNGRKSTGQTTIPVLNRDPARQVSIDQYTQTVKEEAEQRLWDLYKRYESQ